jgi:hypothetical protein
MTARFLMTLALALGMGGVVGCTGDTGPTKDTQGDDDDTVGDDDDDTTEATGPTGTSVDEIIPAQMTMWAQFTVLGGDVADATGKYNSILVVNIGPEDWDPNNDQDTNYCSIYAPMETGGQGMLDAAPVVAPYADVGAAPAAETDCYYYFALPVGFDPTTLITAIPEWSVGIATAITPTMQETLDLIDPAYQDFFLGAHWYIPVLKEPEWETVYSIGIESDGSTIGDDIVRSQTAGQATLPDGLYYSDALIIIDISGLFQ